MDRERPRYRELKLTTEIRKGVGFVSEQHVVKNRLLRWDTDVGGVRRQDTKI